MTERAVIAKTLAKSYQFDFLPLVVSNPGLVANSVNVTTNHDLPFTLKMYAETGSSSQMFTQLDDLEYLLQAAESDLEGEHVISVQANYTNLTYIYNGKVEMLPEGSGIWSNQLSLTDMTLEIEKYLLLTVVNDNQAPKFVSSLETQIV